MDLMGALTKLVVGMSKFGDHLLKRKVSGGGVAALAFACGAGLAHALRSEPRRPPPAPTVTSCGAPDLAEVSMRDTAEGEVADEVADEDEEEGAVFRGLYENSVYGYTVEIPAGMVGAGSPPPAPQHGFGIDLDNPGSTGWNGREGFPRSYLYVDGSYNSLEWGRLDDAVNARLRYLRGDGVNVRVQSRTRTRLGGLRALRVVASYEEGGEEMVSDGVFAFDDGGHASVVYTLGLSTPLSKYERDRPVLEALMNGWCLQPVE